MKEHELEYRKFVIAGVATVIVVVYIIRLFTLQLMSDDYKKNADSNAFLKKIDYPSRGVITDRQGRLMVYNQPSYDIMVVENEARGHFDTLEFCQTLGISREDFDRYVATMHDRRRNPGYSRYTQQLLIGQLSDQDFSLFQEKAYRFPAEPEGAKAALGFLLDRYAKLTYIFPSDAGLKNLIDVLEKTAPEQISVQELKELLETLSEGCEFGDEKLKTAFEHDLNYAIRLLK